MSKFNMLDNNLPILEWDSFCEEIINFHNTHKDTFAEFSPKNEITPSVNEIAHELFVHLIHDYAMSKMDGNYKLNYRLAEA